jgi:hypothetical protein
MQYCYLKSNRSARCKSVAAMISPSNVPELEEQCEAERGQHNGTLSPSCIRSCLRACKTCFDILGTYTSMPRKAKDNCTRSQVRNSAVAVNWITKKFRHSPAMCSIAACTPTSLSLQNIVYRHWAKERETKSDHKFSKRDSLVLFIPTPQFPHPHTLTAVVSFHRLHSCRCRFCRYLFPWHLMPWMQLVTIAFRLRSLTHPVRGALCSKIWLAYPSMTAIAPKMRFFEQISKPCSGKGPRTWTWRPRLLRDIPPFRYPSPI